MLELAKLSNEDLIGELKGLLRKSARLEAELLLYLGEVDARRLYLDEACSSMFVYCTRELGLSEACAYHRIGAARAARRFPAILEDVARGALNTSGVTLMASHLTPENVDGWLGAARGKSKRAIEQLIAERKPKPAVASLVRKLPMRSPEVEATPSSKPRAPKPEPLGLERFKVQFTADRELREKIAEAQDLLSHQIPRGDIAGIFGRALDLLIKEAKRVRFAETDHPRCQSKSNGKPTRHIPAELRRQVAQRDEGRCTFVGTGGKRCPATDRLEFHHRDPWARSQEHSLSNLALLCHAHNQHAADLDFGREWMQQHRVRTSTTTLPGES